MSARRHLFHWLALSGIAFIEFCLPSRSVVAETAAGERLAAVVSSATSNAATSNAAKSANRFAPSVLETVRVYGPPGRFGGWPANHGIWSWGDEILVGFGAGHFKNNGPKRHAIDHDKPEEHLLARSLDGGKTWSIENPAEKGSLIPVGKALHGVTPPGLKEKDWMECPGGIDFTDPDFVFTARMTNHHVGPSRFSYSMDRGRNWEGPFRLPDIENRGVAARTCYLVNGRHDMTLLLTVAKADGKEGRVVCVRTTDGGKSWKFQGWLGDEPKGYAIMPSMVRVGPQELLAAIRCREGDRTWVDDYRSLDDGRTWKHDQIAVADLGEGNPGHLLKLADGRIALTWGFRTAPFAMRAKISSDHGRTWGPEIDLKTNGGGRDIGYPMSVQRADGNVVTLYYFHDELEGDRYIAATIWNPGT